MKKNNQQLYTITVIAFCIACIAIVGIARSCFFVVKQTEQAIVLRLGRPIKVVKTSGLNYKIPFIENVVYFENRILDLIISDKEVIASDQKRMIINAFAKFTIIDPLKFYNAFRGNSSGGSFTQLNNMLESSLRQVVGSKALMNFLSKERADIMQNIEDILNQKVSEYGIKIIDVRIMRADLPKENSSAIYKRMQTERNLEAKQIRAEGEEMSKKIIANTNKEKVIMLSEATKTANIMKGEAEAEVAKIFNKAFGKDIEFYSFYKSMQVYKKSLQKENTKIILTPKNEFLNHLGI